MSNPFQILERETYRLCKADGTVVEDLRTSGVKQGKIKFYRSDVNFEAGDHLERDLPHNKTETLLIEDAEFKSEFDPIPAHYVLTVHNVAKQKAAAAPSSVTYNLYGTNSRVNHHSTDLSSNVVNLQPEEVFRKLDELLSATVEDRRRLSELRALVQEMSDRRDQRSFLQSYSNFMSLAADHLGVLLPLLPVLAQIAANATAQG